MSSAAQIQPNGRINIPTRPGVFSENDGAEQENLVDGAEPAARINEAQDIRALSYHD